MGRVCVFWCVLGAVVFWASFFVAAISTSGRFTGFPCVPILQNIVLAAMDDVCKELAKAVGADVQQMRKTTECPPRVAVIDVLIAITGHSRRVAAKDLRRLVAKYPELSGKIDFDFKFAGERQRKTPVAGVAAIVEVVMLVTGPCAARLRQEVAELMVRYLGGDLRIIREVCEQHGVQEHLQVRAPSDVRCAFRHVAQTLPSRCDATDFNGATFDMQSYTQRLVDEVGKQLAETCRKQMQQTHPWDFQRGAVRDNPLVQEGIIVEGDDLLALDRDEHVVRMTDWLKERVTSQTWERHGHKLKNMFAGLLKKRKREHCRDFDQPLYIARVQGEYRIVYTEVGDDDLMSTVFQDVKRRFNGIVTRDEQAMKRRRRQMRLEEFFQAVNKNVDNEGGPEPHAEPSSRDAFENGCARGLAVAIHSEAIPQAPAPLRIAAKRGDATVSVVG